MKKVVSIILGLILSISPSEGLTILCGKNKEKLEAPGIEKYSIVIGNALEDMGEPEIGFSFPVEKFTKKQIQPVIDLANAIFDDAYLQNLSLNEDKRERLSKNNLFQNKEKVAAIYKDRNLLAMIDDYIIVDYLNIPELKNIIADYIAQTIASDNFIENHFAQNSDFWQKVRGKIHSYMALDIIKRLRHNIYFDLQVTSQGKLQRFWLNSHAIQWLNFQTLENEDRAFWVFSAIFSSDSTQIATTFNNNTAKIWNARSGKLLHTLQGHTGKVKSAVFSPDGLQIVTASHDKTAKIWDASNGKLVHTLEGHTHWVESAAFSPNGTQVVTVSPFRNSAAKIWDTKTGNLLHTLQRVDSAVFSPDGKAIVTVSHDHTAKIWDTNTGELLHTFPHADGVKSAMFSPDGSQVVTSSRDHTAKIWDANTGNLLHTLPHTDSVPSAVFSPNGTRIATTRKNTANIWNAITGDLVNTLTDTSRVSSAAFSPDGSQIITTADYGAAKIWDTSSGELLHTLFEYGDRTYDALFSPDGTQIVTLSPDRTAKIWRKAYIGSLEVALIIILSQKLKEKGETLNLNKKSESYDQKHLSALFDNLDRAEKNTIILYFNKEIAPSISWLKYFLGLGVETVVLGGYLSYKAKEEW